MRDSGPRRSFEINSKEIVREKAMIAKDKNCKGIKLDRVAGPFTFPYFPTLRISPISVIPKISSPQYRLLQNLSFPEHGSVNDFIDKEFCFVRYSNIDDANKMTQNLCKNTKLTKFGVNKSAFT